MPASRKTIPMATVYQKLQTQILICDREERARLCGVLESFLCDTANYRGFHWCDQEGKPLHHEIQAKMECNNPDYYLRRYFFY